MQFIVRLFPEITIKSSTVRKNMSKQLADNLKKLLKDISSDIRVKNQWDNICVEFNDTSLEEHVINTLKHTPGITNFVKTKVSSFKDLHDIYEQTAAIWGEQLKGNTFAVRCKRVGKQDFSSIEAAQYIGGGLNQNFESNGVNLSKPDITINIEIRHENLYIVEEKHAGLGGYPLGTQNAALSLISGGFDSSVSSYLVNARGIRTHYLFFNVGGREHELGVKEVAYYLWHKYGRSHKVKFITVNFEYVVQEILENIANSQMGVVLKRMFLRAASEIAKAHKLEALVTGEAIAQVSSQTLPNLAVIDEITDMLVLRPLITSNKTDIIKVAREIGTENFAASMPEYCGVISVKPTTHARRHKIETEEAKFNFNVLDQAIESAKVQMIEKLGDTHKEPSITPNDYPTVPQGAVVIDIRHPDEENINPLTLKTKTQHIPFYQLHQKAQTLSKETLYLLYCSKGVMSRLHASHMIQSGFKNFHVYRP